MKLISLSKGFISMVDDEDYEFLSQFKWYATESGYACFYNNKEIQQTGIIKESEKSSSR